MQLRIFVEACVLTGEDSLFLDQELENLRIHRRKDTIGFALQGPTYCLDVNCLIVLRLLIINHLTCISFHVSVTPRRGYLKNASIYRTELPKRFNNLVIRFDVTWGLDRPVQRSTRAIIKTGYICGIVELSTNTIWTVTYRGRVHGYCYG